VSYWQPIESAPKDGTTFLGASPNNSAAHPWLIRVMWWDEHFENAGWDDKKDDVIYRAAWSSGRVGSWNYEEYAEEKPTHWMPLPPPPVT
jgi:hypothetical protein